MFPILPEYMISEDPSFNEAFFARISLFRKLLFPCSHAKISLPMGCVSKSGHIGLPAFTQLQRSFHTFVLVVGAAEHETRRFHSQLILLHNGPYYAF